MKRLLEVGLVLCLALPLGTAIPAAAHHKGVHGKHATVKYYRAPKPRAQGTRVLGYELRWGGGYSYTPEDVINTYGDSRTRYGSANVYRDPMLDRQSSFGPFDHGFFFDSAIAPRGGYAPYQQ